jgi:hypothetical protein
MPNIVAMLAASEMATIVAPESTLIDCTEQRVGYIKSAETLRSRAANRRETP